MRAGGLLGEQKENTGPVPGEGRKTACGRMLGSEQRGDRKEGLTRSAFSGSTV